LLLKKDNEVKKHLNDAEFDGQFDFGDQLKHVDTIFKRVFGKSGARRPGQATCPP
jgi:adenylosuccinate lyase